MKQRQPLCASLGGEPHRVVDRAVAPGCLQLELRLGVLRVVDQQVDTVDQFERTGIRRVAAVERLLVV